MSIFFHSDVFHSSDREHFRPRKVLASMRRLTYSGVSLLLAVLAGCGHGTSTRPTAAAIKMTNAAGLTAQSSALSIGSKISLNMTPGNDPNGLGVDWTVTCGGNPTTGSITNGACGTFTPAHTSDGITTVFTAPSVVPIGETVTILATVSSNPSQSSSVSLTILPTPIAVSFFGTSIPPTSLQVNVTANLSAEVTNDPIGKGLIWTATCNAAACGSFNPTTGTVPPVTTTYTAPSAVPAGGTVTITATSLTDTTKSISATVNITPIPVPPPVVPIAVAVLPANVSVQMSGASRVATLTAILSNDTAAAGVNWSLSCGTSNCGSITSHTASGAAASFQNSSTVAAGGIITITAKSTSDSTKFATASATVVTSSPVGITISSGLPSILNSGAQATLVASASSGTDGVNWTANCGSAGACGTFNLSPAHTANGGQIIYTAPSTVPDGKVVTISASSAGTSPSNPAFTTTTLSQSPPPLPSLSFVSTPPASLVSVAALPVAARVANDIAPGGVTWTAQCNSTVPGGCGWFAPVKTASGATTVYTAPPVSAAGTTVTLIATSVADASVKLSSSPIVITPDTTLAVHFIPLLPSQAQPDATIQLNAAVTNDPTQAGVDWKVCPSGCGFFTIKPAVPGIAATATTAPVAPQPPVTATTVSGWPTALPITYTAPSQVPTGGLVAVVASAHADGTTATSGTITVSLLTSGPALNGMVTAGTQPVAGSLVTLYSAGAKGYGSASTQIAASLPTAKDGSFTIPSGYSCLQPDSQMYLVATGGKVGTNDPNPNLALMTALGSCDTLSSNSVSINEVTTVASAYATAQFAADDALTGNSSYLYLGSSATNRAGLAYAFAAANNLVDVSTGKARFLVPAENAIVPYVQINTFADFLNACAATSGGALGDGSACGDLFITANTLGTGTYPSSIAPADTLQAAFNIAQHPVSNYNYNLNNLPQLFSLATSGSPFQPVLTSQPNDWSISLHYTGGGGLSPASTVGSLAIDSAGNLWITDTKAGSVIEWNPTGAAWTPSTGFPAGGGRIAIDTSDNVWISGPSSLVELTDLGTPLPWSPFAGLPGTATDAVFDAQSNLWIIGSNGVNEYSNLGIGAVGTNLYTFDSIPNPSALGIDSSNNVWIGATADGNALGHIAELSNPGGSLIVSQNAGPVLPQMAADATGNIWYINGSICEAAPYAGKGSTLLPNCFGTGGSNSASNGLEVWEPQGIATDGAGVVWIANPGGSSNSIPPGVLPIKAASSPTNAKPYVSSSLAAGPLRVAIDGSGNIWVLLSDNTVTEYVSLAAPTVTPLALGLKNNKIGAKP